MEVVSSVVTSVVTSVMSSMMTSMVTPMVTPMVTSLMTSMMGLKQESHVDKNMMQFQWSQHFNTLEVTDFEKKMFGLPSSVLPLGLVGLIIHFHQCECDGHRPSSCTKKMLLIYNWVNFALCLFKRFSIHEVTRELLRRDHCVTSEPENKGNISGNKRRPECKTTHISVATS